MEKRDLEVKYNGRTLGAFENVTNVVEGMNDDNQETLSFDSDDGHFDFTKQFSGLYEDPNHLNIKFTSYNVQVRRTTYNHIAKAGTCVSLRDTHQDIRDFRMGE